MEFENQYLEYYEYKKLGGNLSEMSFNLLEYRAEKQIDEMTSGRFRKLSEYPIELKLCINELITENIADKIIYLKDGVVEKYDERENILNELLKRSNLSDKTYLFPLALA